MIGNRGFFKKNQERNKQKKKTVARKKRLRLAGLHISHSRFIDAAQTHENM